MSKESIDHYFKSVKSENNKIVCAFDKNKVIYSKFKNIICAGSLGSGRTINLRNILFFHYIKQNKNVKFYIIDLYRSAEDYSIFRNKKNIEFIHDIKKLEEYNPSDNKSIFLIENYHYTESLFKKNRNHSKLSKLIENILKDENKKLFISISESFQSLINNNLKDNCTILTHMIKNEKDKKYLIGNNKGIGLHERGHFKIDQEEKSYSFPYFEENEMMTFMNFQKNKEDFLKNIK